MENFYLCLIQEKYTIWVAHYPQAVLETRTEVIISSEVNMSANHCVNQWNLVSTDLYLRRAPLAGLADI